jgi:hypothetical protein
MSVSWFSKSLLAVTSSFQFRQTYFIGKSKRQKVPVAWLRRFRWSSLKVACSTVTDKNVVRIVYLTDTLMRFDLPQWAVITCSYLFIFPPCSRQWVLLIVCASCSKKRRFENGKCTSCIELAASAPWLGKCIRHTKNTPSILFG